VTALFIFEDWLPWIALLRTREKERADVGILIVALFLVAFILVQFHGNERRQKELGSFALGRLR
jgi:hypothetical protein